MVLKVKTPKNYPEMLDRIKTFTTLSTFFCLIVIFFSIDCLRIELNNLNNFLLNELNIENITIFGIVFKTASILILLIISVIIGLIFRYYLLHDKISDLFKIRLNYDIEIIIKPLLNEKGIIIVQNIEDKIVKKRDTLMDILFYDFAGTNEPVINIHYVYMALDSWSYYWINIETSIVLLISSIVSLIYYEFIISIIFIYIFIVLLFINHFRLRTCKKATKNEMRLIIETKEFKSIEKSKIYEILS